MTELEKKLLLTEDEYSCLLNRFGEGKPVLKQINYYFDTDDLSMNRQNITCRIRLKDGKYQGTMKRHIPNTDYSTETEMEVRNGIYDNAFTDMGLKFQGELITERCILLKDSVCEVVLDKNKYLGHTDYELEIEYLPDCEREAHSVLQTFLNELMQCKSVLTLKEISEHLQNVPSKSNRFFERRTKNDFNTQ